jgi:branched-chain amino acid aminotransferase
MLYVEFSPELGWSAPQIKPYGPLNLDPASSCFHYCPNVFEGHEGPSSHILARQSTEDILRPEVRAQAYRGPDGTPRLFRPQLNMERMLRSAERVALPVCTHPRLLSDLHSDDLNHYSRSHSTQTRS